MLDREREAVSSLRLQLEEVQKREAEVRRENDRLVGRDRQLDMETHKRYLSQHDFFFTQFLFNVQHLF